MRISDWSSDVCSPISRLQTRDQTYMILPNSQIARQRLTNYSAPRRHYRAQVPIVLDHAVPVADAKPLLTEAVAAAPLILGDRSAESRVGKGGVRQCRTRW